MRRIAIIGATGGIGNAFIQHLTEDPENLIYAFSRMPDIDNQEHMQGRIISGYIDITNEESIKDACKLFDESKLLDMILITTGILHDKDMQPEKALKDITPQSLSKAFEINAIGPILIAKHFMPYLKQGSRSIIAFLSARVGSISDNYLGGWYSYRASKAALNMLIKSLSI